MQMACWIHGRIFCRVKREKDQEKKELRAWEECGQTKSCRKGTAARGPTHWRGGKGARGP